MDNYNNASRLETSGLAGSEVESSKTKPERCPQRGQQSQKTIKKRQTRHKCIFFPSSPQHLPHCCRDEPVFNASSTDSSPEQELVGLFDDSSQHSWCVNEAAVPGENRSNIADHSSCQIFCQQSEQHSPFLSAPITHFKVVRTSPESCQDLVKLQSMTSGRQIQARMECCLMQSAPSSDIRCSLRTQERSIKLTAQCSFSEVVLSPTNSQKSFRTNRHKPFRRRNEDSQTPSSALEELTPPALRDFQTETENLEALPVDEMINASEMLNKSVLVEGPYHFSIDKFWEDIINSLSSGKTPSTERYKQSTAKGLVTRVTSVSCSPARSLSRNRPPNLPKPQVTGDSTSRTARVFSRCQPGMLSPEDILAQLDTMIDQTSSIYENYSNRYSYKDDEMVQKYQKYLVTLAQVVSAYRNKSSNSGYNDKKLPKKKNNKTESTLQAGSSHERGLQVCLDKARLACTLQGSVGLMGNRADNYAASLAYQQSVKDFEATMKEFLKEKSEEGEASLQTRSQPSASSDKPTDASNWEPIGLTLAGSLLRSETFVVDDLTISRPSRSKNQGTIEREGVVNEHDQQARATLGKERSKASSSRGLLKASSASYTIVAKQSLQVDHKPSDAHASQSTWYETHHDSSVLDQDLTFAGENKHMTRNWFTPEKEKNRSSASRSLEDSDRLPLMRSEKLFDDKTNTDNLKRYRSDNTDTSCQLCTKQEDFKSIRAYGKSISGGSLERARLPATHSSDASTFRKLDVKPGLRPKKGSTIGIYKRIIPSFDDFMGFDQDSPDIDSQNCHSVSDDWKNDNEKGLECVVIDSRTVPNQNEMTERFTDYHKKNDSMERGSGIGSVDHARDKTFCRLHDSQPTYSPGNLTTDMVSPSKDSSHDKIGNFKYSEKSVIPSQKSPEKLTPADHRKDNQRFKKKWQRPGESKPPFNPGLGAEKPVWDRSSSDEDAMDDLQSEPSPSDLLRHRQKMEVATKLEELNQFAKRKKKAKSPLRKRTFPDLVWMNKDISKDDLEGFADKRGGALSDSSKFQQPLPAYSFNSEEKQTDDATGSVLVSQPENVCLSISQLFHSKAEADAEHCLHRDITRTAAETVLEGEKTTEIKTSGAPKDEDSTKAPVFSVEERADLPENPQNETLTTTNSSPSSTSAEYILHPLTDGVTETISAPQLMRDFTATVPNVAPNSSRTRQKVGPSRAMQNLAQTSDKDQFHDQIDARAMSGLSLGCENHVNPKCSNMAPERFKFKPDTQRTPCKADKTMGLNEEPAIEIDLVTHKIRPLTFNNISETEQLIREKSATELNVKRFPYPESYVTLENNPTLDILALSADVPRCGDESRSPVDADETPQSSTPRTSHTNAEREDPAKTYSVDSPPKPNICTRRSVHSYFVELSAIPLGVSEKEEEHHDSSREGWLKETRSFSVLGDEVEFESNHDSGTSNFVHRSTVGKEEKRKDSEYCNQTVSDRSESGTGDEEQLLDSQSRLVNVNSASSEVSRARNDSSGSPSPGARRRTDSGEATEGSGSGTYQQIRNSQSLEQASLDCMATDRGRMEQKVLELKEKVECLERILGYHRQCCHPMQQTIPENQPASLYKCWCHPFGAVGLPGPNLYEPYACQFLHTVNFSPAGLAAGPGAPSQSCTCPAGPHFPWFSPWPRGPKTGAACRGPSARSSYVISACQTGKSPGSDSGDPPLDAGSKLGTRNTAQSQTATEAGTMDACTSFRTEMSQIHKEIQGIQQSTNNSQKLHNSIVSLQEEVDTHKKELAEMWRLLEKIESSLSESQRDQGPSSQEFETLRQRVADLTLQRDAEKVFHRITRQSLRSLEQDHDRLRQEYVLANCRRCRTGDSVVQRRVWSYLNNDVNPGNQHQDENHNHRPEWRPGYTGRLAVYLEGSGCTCSRKRTGRDMPMGSCSGEAAGMERFAETCSEVAGGARKPKQINSQTVADIMRPSLFGESEDGASRCGSKLVGRMCPRLVYVMRPTGSCSRLAAGLGLPPRLCSRNTGAVEKLDISCSNRVADVEKPLRSNSVFMGNTRLQERLCSFIVPDADKSGSCSRDIKCVERPERSCSRISENAEISDRCCSHVSPHTKKPFKICSCVFADDKIRHQTCSLVAAGVDGSRRFRSRSDDNMERPDVSCSSAVAHTRMLATSCTQVIADVEKKGPHCLQVEAGKNSFDIIRSLEAEMEKKPDIFCSAVVVPNKRSVRSSSRGVADKVRPGASCLQHAGFRERSRRSRSRLVGGIERSRRSCSRLVGGLERSRRSRLPVIGNQERSCRSPSLAVGDIGRSSRSRSRLVGGIEQSSRSPSHLVMSQEMSRKSPSRLIGVIERLSRLRGSHSRFNGGILRSSRSSSKLVGGIERSSRSPSRLVDGIERSSRSRKSRVRLIRDLERSIKSHSRLVSGQELPRMSIARLIGGIERLSRPRRSRVQFYGGLRRSSRSPSRLAGGIERSSRSPTRLVGGIERSSRSPSRLVGGIERSSRSPSRLVGGIERSSRSPTWLAGGIERSSRSPLRLVGGIERSSRSSTRLAGGIERSSRSPSRLVGGIERSSRSPSLLVGGIERSSRSPSRLVGGIERSGRSPSRLVGGIERSSRSPSRLVGGIERSSRSPSRLAGGIERSSRSPSRLFGGPERSRRSPLQLVAGLQKSIKSGSSHLSIVCGLSISRESRSRLVGSRHTSSRSSTPAVIELETSRRSVSPVGNGLERYFGSPLRMVGDLDRLRRSHSPVVVCPERSRISCSPVNCGLERLSRSYSRVDNGQQGLRTSHPRVVSSAKRLDNSCSRHGSIDRHSSGHQKPPLPSCYADVIKKNNRY